MDYVCGTCKYWDCDECYCMATGNHKMYEQDTCDGWTDPEEVEPTIEEQLLNAGDDEANRIMIEGREI